MKRNRTLEYGHTEKVVDQRLFFFCLSSTVPADQLREPHQRQHFALEAGLAVAVQPDDLVLLWCLFTTTRDFRERALR